MTTTQQDIIELVRDGKRFREKRSKWERFWLNLFIRFVIIAPLDGWLFMLAIGIAHHEWLPDLPTIGYWPATLLMVFFVALFGKAGTGTTKVGQQS